VWNELFAVGRFDELVIASFELFLLVFGELNLLFFLKFKFLFYSSTTISKFFLSFNKFSLERQTTFSDVIIIGVVSVFFL
jgi:hypothetical protein